MHWNPRSPRFAEPLLQALASSVRSAMEANDDELVRRLAQLCGKPPHLIEHVIANRRSATAANAPAPIPAPPTSGHCTLHAAAPPARRQLACASSHAFAAA